MERLIEVVKDYPVLYDTSHKYYLRTNLKNDLWEKIAKELNYTDGKAAKDQWRKLRGCHREAIRRKQKKSGPQATNTRPWMYQEHMEFLQPFMKNQTTVGNSHPSALEESQSEDDGDGEKVSHPPNIETDGDERDESIGSPAPKKIKKSATIDSVVRKYIKDSDKRANARDELRRNLVNQTQKEAGLHNDALHHFFMSMYNTTKGLPTKYQRQVKRKVFEAVSQAEDDAECETPNLQMNSQFSSSSTPNSRLAGDEEYLQIR